MSKPRKSKARPRAVLYLRQSVSREESISLELQESSGRQYAEQQGYEVIRVEADPGISGRTWNRPAVQRVMAMVENGQADVIILWKWSRLSRARLDWAVAIDKVESAGGRIESATEQVDVSTSTGRFARGMLAEFAAFESERIGDIWKEAQSRRAAQGLPHSGRPRLGYTYTREDGYTINEAEAPVIRDCYRQFIAGASFQALCQHLDSTDLKPLKNQKDTSTGRWNTRSLRDIMDNPFMIGQITYRGETQPGAHPALIDEETWAAYQVAGKRRRRQQSPKRSYVYSGLVYCARCGYQMSGCMRVNGDISYRCDGYADLQLHKGGYVAEKIVDEHLRPWLAELVTLIRAEAEANQTSLPKHDPTPHLRRALMKVESRRDSLTTGFLDGLVPADVYERMRDQLADEKAQLEEQLAQASVEARALPAVLDADLLARWEDLPVERRRALLHALLKGIVVTPQRPRSLVRLIGKWEADELPARVSPLSMG